MGDFVGNAAGRNLARPLDQAGDTKRGLLPSKVGAAPRACESFIGIQPLWTVVSGEDEDRIVRFTGFLDAVEKAGYTFGEQVKIALDCASSELYDSESGTYTLDGKKMDSDGMIELLSGWIDKYPICSIEDALDEDDWDGW